MDQDLVIPQQDLRRLLASACPEAAFLYLYLHSGKDMPAAEEELRLNRRQLDLASATLRQMGLFPEPEPRHLMPSEAPVYTEADLTREYASNPEFPAMVGEVQRRMGRILSTEELKLLLGIYRYLGLPIEVISILIHYCMERSRAHSGRMPSMRSIEKEAYRWADLGIDTVEEAAVYMQNEMRRQTRVGRICEILQITGRRLTPGEEKFVFSWIDWGFPDEVIRAAYEKTCMNTSGLKWPYLHAILKSWHEQGLSTLQQIEEQDRAPAARPTERKGSRPAVQQHGDGLSDLERRAVEQMLNKGLYDEEV